jgi:hypothetical protein
MDSSCLKLPYQDEYVSIDEDLAGLTILHLQSGPWGPHITRLAKQFRAKRIDFRATEDWTDTDLSFLKEFGELQSLDVELPFQWAEHTLDFLAYVPNLTSLNLRAGPRVRWEKIETLKRLRELAVFLRSPGPEPRPIEFSALTDLVRCRLGWTPAWNSVLKAKQIKDLQIHEIYNNIPAQLTHLDCSSLLGLERLTLLGCKRLKSITLGSDVRIRELWVNGSPRLHLGSLLGEHLEKLTVIGNVASEWEEIAKAKRLKRLDISFASKLRSAPFIKELPMLELVSISGKLPEDEEAYMKAINDRFRAKRKKEAKIA